jgi:flagellar assembly factor FliW
MRIQTRSLGAVEATPESFITLPEGLLGFEAHREFALVTPQAYAPFRFLLSFDDPDVALPVLPAVHVGEDYRPALAASDARALGAGPNDALEIYVIATIDPAVGRLIVNLRAPLVVHVATRVARQVVLSDGRWSVDHALAGGVPAQKTRQAA